MEIRDNIRSYGLRLHLQLPRCRRPGNAYYSHWLKTDLLEMRRGWTPLFFLSREGLWRSGPHRPKSPFGRACYFSHACNRHPSSQDRCGEIPGWARLTFPIARKALVRRLCSCGEGKGQVVVKATGKLRAVDPRHTEVPTGININVHTPHLIGL